MPLVYSIFYQEHELNAASCFISCWRPFLSIERKSLKWTGQSADSAWPPKDISSSASQHLSEAEVHNYSSLHMSEWRYAADKSELD